MKKNIIVILLAISTVFTFKAAAQSSEVPNLLSTNPVPFVGQVYNWATSISYDPSTAWTNNAEGTWELSTGARQVAGFGASDYVIGQKDIGAWSVGAEIDFNGVGSVINSGEIRGGYAFVRKGDFEMECSLGAGYGQNSQSRSAFVIEPEISAKKKFTKLTFGEVRVSEPVYASGKFSSVPTIKAGAGFNF